MNEPGAFGRPAAGLVFLIVGEDGDRVSIRTNEAGVASTWLAPGEYRLVTPDPLDWEGYAYTWDRMVTVTTRAPLISSTQNEARSVALSASTETGPHERTGSPLVIARTLEDGVRDGGSPSRSSVNKPERGSTPEPRRRISFGSANPRSPEKRNVVQYRDGIRRHHLRNLLRRSRRL
jgi:hypothetical protein